MADSNRIRQRSFNPPQVLQLVLKTLNPDSTDDILFLFYEQPKVVIRFHPSLEALNLIGRQPFVEILFDQLYIFLSVIHD